MYEGGYTIEKNGSLVIPGVQNTLPTTQKPNILTSVPWQNWRNKVQNLQVLPEHNKTYLDIDETELLFDGNQQMATNRLKRVKNWRLLNKNSILDALWFGNLRPHDKNFMISILISFLSWIGLLIGLSIVYKGFIGALIMLPVLYFAISGIIASSVLY